MQMANGESYLCGESNDHVENHAARCSLPMPIKNEKTFKSVVIFHIVDVFNCDDSL